MANISNEEVYHLVETMKYELEGLLDTEPVEGHIAEEQIRMAVEHLESAGIDLEDAMLNE